MVEEAWPLPAVVVAYHITYDGHPDSYPLHITSKILSDGQSARIPRELVYKKRLALTAFGSGNITEQPNLFYAVAIVQPGQTPEAAEQALIDEFEKLKREPVTATELQRAKNQFARDYIVGRESNQDKALHLAHAAVIHNDITTADGEFDIFTNVTTADVQRVARTYFNETNRTVLLHPAESRRVAVRWPMRDLDARRRAVVCRWRVLVASVATAQNPSPTPAGRLNARRGRCRRGR